MKNSILLILFFTSNLIHAQTSLTSYSVNLPMNDSFNIKLIDIEKSNIPFYFRLFLNGQTVDIFSYDNEVYHGEIINSIKQYEQVKVDGHYYSVAIQLFTNKIEIDSLSAKSIAQKIISTKQFYIPTDSLIPNWEKRFLHCGSIIFEMKMNGKYIKQSFHCPWSQNDSLEFKEIIVSNYKLLKQGLKLDSIYGEFTSQLPKGRTYSRSGYGMMYIMTTKEEVAWEKDRPRREYLKSMKDTIDNYLNMKLNILESSNSKTKYSCYDGYYLTFGKDGKLKNIWTHPSDVTLSDGLSEFINDRREKRKCYRNVKEIFKKVNLCDFELKQPVYRTFYIKLGTDFMIVDNTIY